MSMDILALWDFADPEGSEQRFRAAMIGASIEDRAILQTQIARTYGIRRNYEQARDMLSEVLPLVQNSPEVEVRYNLEMGRTYCSTMHDPETLTKGVKELGRNHFMRAFDGAKQAGLDYLGIDALHMMTVVDSDPSAQIEWNQRALTFMKGSQQIEAKKWEGSLRNNLGYALHMAGRFDEALAEFRASLEARLASGNTSGARVAKWMIAWTLRAKGDLQEALTMQLLLEEECLSAGNKDQFVYEELATLYQLLGDEEQHNHYKELTKSAF